MASVELAITILTICTVTGTELPTVTVQQGTLQGTNFKTVWGKEYLAFLGIPYAKPPVGDLRFRAPQPPESWEGIYNATDEGNWCPQQHVMANEYVGNEDCLFLNIYTHKLPKSASDLKAVMVWIHGGAFKLGTGSSTMYGPDHFLEEDVVIATIQYRIGILGFISLPEAGIPGNNGMKDQVMALRWVQKNIAVFGGDPNRVTIFGQSAGGASVHYHLLSPMSKGLFYGAISQSGSALDPWAFNEPEALSKAAFEFGKNIGCDTTNATELYHCLQRQPETSLVDETNMKVQFIPTRESSSENGEENFLIEHPKSIISAGRFQNVPFVTGALLYESAFFLEMLSVTHTDDVASCLKSLAGLMPNVPEPAKIVNFFPKIKSIYYKENTTTEDGTTDLLTDIMFLFGAHQTVRGHAAMSSSPVYYYNFAYDGDLAFTKQIALSSRKGPTHSDELGYEFRAFFSPELDVESEDIKILRRMVKMWTNFAKYGDPIPEVNSKLTVKWDHMTKTNNVYLKIDKELSMQRDLQKERMALWEEIIGSTN